MKAKIIILFALAWISVVSVILWQVDQRMSADQMRSFEAQMKSQLSSVSTSVQREAEIISRLMTGELSRGVSELSSSSQQRLEMVGMVQWGAGSNTNAAAGTDADDLKISREMYQPNSTVKTWSKAYLLLALKGKNLATAVGDNIQWSTVIDPQRHPWYMVIKSNPTYPNTAQVALVPVSVIQNVIDPLVGQVENLAVINDGSQIIGHEMVEYIGSTLLRDSVEAAMAKEISEHQANSGAGLFKKDLASSLFGVYERVENTNVWITVAAEPSHILAPLVHLKNQILYISVGLGFLMLAFLMFYIKDTAIEKFSENFAAATLPGEALSATAAAAATMSRKDSESNFIHQVAASVTEELQAPLVSILAQVHLAKSKASNADELEHLEKIEAQARSSREVLEKLKSLAGDKKLELRSGSLRMAVEQALLVKEKEIFAENIQLKKDFKEVPAIMMSQPELSRAIELILDNSFEALSSKTKKEIEILLHSSENGVSLEIIDHGRGLSEAEASRAFEPFFTTKRGQQRLGLGLTQVRQIVELCSGQVQIIPSASATTVRLDFPVATDMVNAQIQTGQQADLNQVVHAPPMNVPQTPLSQEENLPPELEPIASVFSNEAIEEAMTMIDTIDELPDTQSSPPSVESSLAPTLKEAEATSESTPPALNALSSKFMIQKPDFHFEPKKSELDDFEFSIRRPGEKAGDRV